MASTQRERRGPNSKNGCTTCNFNCRIRAHTPDFVMSSAAKRGPSASSVQAPAASAFLRISHSGSFASEWQTRSREPHSALMLGWFCSLVRDKSGNVCICSAQRLFIRYRDSSTRIYGIAICPNSVNLISPSTSHFSKPGAPSHAVDLDSQYSCYG